MQTKTINSKNNSNIKKAELSQRPARCAYYMVPWKLSRVPENAHGYFSRNFRWAFVHFYPMNVRSKCEFRSFTRSGDNRRYSKNLGSPWIRPRCFLQNFEWAFVLIDLVNVPAKFEDSTRQAQRKCPQINALSIDNRSAKWPPNWKY